MENVAKALANARAEREWSMREVRDRTVEHMHQHTPTEQTIAQYHKAGKLPAKPDLTLLLALARVYQDPEVSRTVGIVLDNIADMLISSIQEIRSEAIAA